jgi:hypothetical protein
VTSHFGTRGNITSHTEEFGVGASVDTVRDERVRVAVDRRLQDQFALRIRQLRPPPEAHLDRLGSADHT